MRSFAVVFAREIRERRATFLAALAAGLFAFPLALVVQKTSGFAFRECLSAMAYPLAAFLGFGLAVGLGATIIGRDLSEGRLGFFLSKPVSSLGLWAGKMGAAWALVVGSVGLVLLPSVLAGAGTPPLERPSNPWYLLNIGGPNLPDIWLVAAAAVLLLVAVAVSNALGVMFRSKSLLVLLDGILAAGFIWAVVAMLRHLMEWGAWLAVPTVVLAAAVLVLLASLAAGAAQVALGRTDPKRGHKALSTVLWVVLAAGGVSLFAYSWSAAYLKPQDLGRVSGVEAPANGDWFIVGGPTTGDGAYFYSDFLLNASTGAWHRLPVDLWNHRPLLSPDGRWCVWLKNSGGVRHPRFELTIADLKGNKLSLKETGIVMNREEAWSSSLVFSGDSSRLALFLRGQVTVYDLPGLQALASARLPTKAAVNESACWCGHFAGDVRLILYGFTVGKGPTRAPAAYTLGRFDVAARKVAITGRIENVNNTVIRFSPSGDTLLVGRHLGDKEVLSLVDGGSGQVISDLVSSSKGYKYAGAFLPDGRIVTAQNTRGRPVLTLWDARGRALASTELTGCKWVTFDGEPKAGTVLLSAWPDRQGWYLNGTVRLWTLDSNAVRALPGLHPMRNLDTFWGRSTGRVARYFQNDAGNLVRVDWPKETPTVVLKLKGNMSTRKGSG